MAVQEFEPDLPVLKSNSQPTPIPALKLMKYKRRKGTTISEKYLIDNKLILVTPWHRRLMELPFLLASENLSFPILGKIWLCSSLGWRTHILSIVLMPGHYSLWKVVTYWKGFWGKATKDKSFWHLGCKIEILSLQEQALISRGPSQENC